MTTTVSTAGVATPALLSLLSAAEEYVAECSVAALSGPELAAELAVRERLRRVLSAADHALLLEVDRRGVAVECGARSTSGWVQDVLRVPPGEANGRVRAAYALGCGLSFTGQPMPPLLPATAEADGAGLLSAAHVREILSVMDDLPPDLTAAQVGEADRILAEVAARFAPKQVGQVGQRLVDTINPDGAEPAEVPLARRGLELHRRRDGWLSLTGRLSPECSAEAEAVLNAFAAPRPGTDTNGTVEPDRRTPSQRRHDALQDLLGLALRADTLPITGRRAQLILTTDTDPINDTDPAMGDAGGLSDAMGDAGGDPRGGLGDVDCFGDVDCLGDVDCFGDADALDDADAVSDSEAMGGSASPGGGARTQIRVGLARSAYTSFGQRLPRHLALQLCDTAMLSIVTLDRAGAVLDYGQSRRLATKAQHRALIARDGGCSFPGCDHPPEWCDAHHVIAWIDHGPTAIGNLTLVCGYHHRNFQRLGWTCRLTSGIPEWIPPPHIDPNQRAQRHHRFLLRELHQTHSAARSGAYSSGAHTADRGTKPANGHPPGPACE